MEANLRVYACEILTQAGHRLDLPQVTISCAQVLLHRFYFVKSLAKYDVKDITLGVLFLATKLEENHTDPRSLLNVLNHIYQVREARPQEALNIFESAYIDQKDTMYAAERKILKALGFRVFVELPHRYILPFLKILGCHQNNELVQKCWSYLNDSMRTTLCCQYSANIIAAASIYLSVRNFEKSLPENWHTLFDATLKELEDSSLQILMLYEMNPKCHYVELAPKNN